jgi:hypothetical protein
MVLIMASRECFILKNFGGNYKTSRSQ